MNNNKFVTSTTSQTNAVVMLEFSSSSDVSSHRVRKELWDVCVSISTCSRRYPLRIGSVYRFDNSFYHNDNDNDNSQVSGSLV